MEGRGNEGRVGLALKKLSTPQLKFLVAPLGVTTTLRRAMIIKIGREDREKGG